MAAGQCFPVATATAAKKKKLKIPIDHYTKINSKAAVMATVTCNTIQKESLHRVHTGGLFVA